METASQAKLARYEMVRICCKDEVQSKSEGREH